MYTSIMFFRDKPSAMSATLAQRWTHPTSVTTRYTEGRKQTTAGGGRLRSVELMDH